MHSHTGCICLIFLHYAFSNVSSNGLHEKMHNHTSCICLIFLAQEFVPSPPVGKLCPLLLLDKNWEKSNGWGPIASPLHFHFFISIKIKIYLSVLGITWQSFSGIWSYCPAYTQIGNVDLDFYIKRFLKGLLDWAKTQDISKVCTSLSQIWHDCPLSGSAASASGLVWSWRSLNLILRPWVAR